MFRDWVYYRKIYDVIMYRIGQLTTGRWQKIAMEVRLDDPG